MEHTLAWQDAVMRLHIGGWDTDDIDAACEALVEASEGSGSELRALTRAQVEDILETKVEENEVPALLLIARLRASESTDAHALREALYDLDAFAYAYAGDD